VCECIYFIHVYYSNLKLKLMAQPHGIYNTSCNGRPTVLQWPSSFTHCIPIESPTTSERAGGRAQTARHVNNRQATRSRPFISTAGRLVRNTVQTHPLHNQPIVHGLTEPTTTAMQLHTDAQLVDRASTGPCSVTTTNLYRLHHPRSDHRTTERVYSDEPSKL